MSPEKPTVSRSAKLSSQVMVSVWALLFALVPVAAEAQHSPSLPAAPAGVAFTAERWGLNETDLNRLNGSEIRRQARARERVDELQRASADGDPYAMLLIGVDSNGLSETRADSQRRLQLLEKACLENVARGCVELAARLASSNPSTSEVSRAITSLEQRCNTGNPRACYEWGQTYLDNTYGRVVDYNRAHQLWERACTMGVAQSCESLGMGYELGIEVPRDLARARAYNQRACEFGSTNGCDRAGMNQRQGDREAAERRLAEERAAEAARQQAAADRAAAQAAAAQRAEEARRRASGAPSDEDLLRLYRDMHVASVAATRRAVANNPSAQVSDLRALPESTGIGVGSETTIGEAGRILFSMGYSSCTPLGSRRFRCSFTINNTFQSGQDGSSMAGMMQFNEELMTMFLGDMASGLGGRGQAQKLNTLLSRDSQGFNVIIERDAEGRLRSSELANQILRGALYEEWQRN